MTDELGWMRRPAALEQELQALHEALEHAGSSAAAVVTVRFGVAAERSGHCTVRAFRARRLCAPYEAAGRAKLHAHPASE
ncbi:hypothetical protein HUS23_06500 [Ectothiorhodospiraceae bacterium 2226]|nr:hypothetical protein HUS23_06500 [Ectothiorhodospiraceae bacterium 2226]